MQEIIFDDVQTPAPKVKQTKVREILLNLLFVVFFSYVLVGRVECKPNLHEWLSKVRIILLVNLSCGVISRVQLGSFIRNVEKIVKILSVAFGCWYMIYGAYLAFNDESCQKDWPLGFYTVMVIGMLSTVLIIIFFVSICCLIGTAYFYKDKSE